MYAYVFVDDMQWNGSMLYENYGHNYALWTRMLIMEPYCLSIAFS